MNNNFTRNEKVIYSVIVILLPIIGIPIYFGLRECSIKNNEYTIILNRIIDIILIITSLCIILSIILNKLSMDSILGRTAVIIALIYNLSILSKRKKTRFTIYCFIINFPVIFIVMVFIIVIL